MVPSWELLTWTTDIYPDIDWHIGSRRSPANTRIPDFDERNIDQYPDPRNGADWV
jgi:hypothetical protein